MRRGSCVGVILLLALAFLPGRLHAQQPGGTSGAGQGFRLEQNYPNPFNPVTTIPFDLGEGLFTDGKPVVVTIRIFNVLQQLVAIPVALDYPGGNGPKVENLPYTMPGHKEARWDGFDRNGNKVASGVYYLQLTVNGTSRVIKILVGK